MLRQDERDAFGDAEIFGRNQHALGGDALDFLEKSPGVNDHAVADERELAGADDAGGQQAELVLDAVDDQRVARIVAALETNDDIGAAGQPIDDFAFAFIAPLGADDRDIAHCLTSQGWG